MKKGQVTILLILSVLVLVLGFLLITVSGKETDRVLEETVFANNAQLLQEFVESCLEAIGQEAVYFTASQGGYYKAPVESSPYLNLEVAHYWHDGKNLMPSKERIEKEISLYVKDNLKSCLNEFSSFQKQGYIVEQDFEIPKVRMDSKITSDSVLLNLDYPLKLKKDNSIITRNKYSATVKINLNKIINLSSQILKGQTENPNDFPLGSIVSLAEENKIKLQTIDLEGNLVFLTFAVPLKNKENLMYSFAHKYDWVESGIR